MKLWHCINTRSLRALWMLEEVGVDYELEVLPYPPRVKAPEYLEDSPLGSIPYFVDGDIALTESVVICQYLADRYKPELSIASQQTKDHFQFLNWLQFGEASMMTDLSMTVRYRLMDADYYSGVIKEFEERYLRKLNYLNQKLENRQYLMGDCFTVADISVGYTLFIGSKFPFYEQYPAAVKNYLTRLQERDAFKRALARKAP